MEIITLKTKEELTADKAVVDAKIAILQTKLGADAFIRRRIALNNAYLTKLTKEYKATCEASLIELKVEPAKVVTRELQKLDLKAAEMSSQIKDVDVKVTVIDGK